MSSFSMQGYVHFTIKQVVSVKRIIRFFEMRLGSVIFAGLPACCISRVKSKKAFN